ncbi:MAG TPA: protein-L-isoaspartate O-methyltransferase [Methanothrix sp.]|nr:protein-L-isoaspartate O-methyltransferase [Methanothrix sp.]HRW82819.1 protein-L-isoaspartate O-methyltransferase [Methanothrix sp.]
MKDDMLRMLRGNISDRVVEAMDRTPRELFVPEGIRTMAYEDHPLPIGQGQTISAPHMVAIMCDVLDLGAGMKVLDVGAGSGYHAAVMAELVGPEGHVYSIERVPELVVYARRNLREAGVENVTVVEGDGSLGLPDHAPYDRINVAATAPKVPEPLKEQLKVGGKLVVPVGTCYQELVLVIRTDEGFELEHHGGVVFVPLIGDHGFKI